VPMIAVLKDDPSRCSDSCPFIIVSALDGDCYGFICRYFNKSLGWYPELKRLPECIEATKEKARQEAD